MPAQRVPYDPELIPALHASKQRMEPGPLTPHTILDTRRRFRGFEIPLPELIGDRPIQWTDHTVPGPPGAPDVVVTVLRPQGPTGGAGIYNIHGGGMILGSRTGGLVNLLDMVVDHGVVVGSVEYRLAPEAPHPAPVEDCYAGLVWMAGHAAELGFDPARQVVIGASAGGGLAAGVSLLARDRGGPALAGQGLICPMIDDRNNTVSSHQYADVGLWDRSYNHAGWTALLGSARGGPDVSPYAAPARATDLSGLPPAYIEVGSAEVFRDENVAYATRIWATGGQAELHVWAGGFHGFTSVPEARVAQAALAARRSWLERILHPRCAPDLRFVT
ncbi:alpha/beta hydrolase [Phytoactinopolyspora limicola]|uniref:alpha/beta hydrolase n=1 Tax=Phytoactinopolyspora limicola TaxID=2715536 RepID=UPI00140D7412|nr:alpha/beta hydrolase [Phytoactinopolyspora limicola]